MKNNYFCLKSLIEDVIAGKFEEALGTLESNTAADKLETKDALKVIVACCTACHAHMSKPHELSEGHLCSLIKFLVKSIESPTGNCVENYVRSMFYVVKLLLEKKAYTHLIGLEDQLLPEFLPKNPTSKQIQVLKSTGSLIYRAIAQIVKNKDTIDCCDTNTYFTKLCHLVIVFYGKLQNSQEFAEVVCYIFRVLPTLVTDCECLQDFFCAHLDIFATTSGSADVQINSNILNGFFEIYVILLKKNDFHGATICSEKSLLTLKTLGGEETSCLGRILEICIWLVPTSNHEEGLLKDCHQSLRSAYKQLGCTPLLRTVSIIISRATQIVSLHYKTNDIEGWVEKIPPETQLKFYQFLCDLSNALAKAPNACKCERCQGKTNTAEATRLLGHAMYLGKLYILNAKQVVNGYKVDYCKYLDKYVAYIGYIKENLCEKWDNHWYQAADYMYNIGINLQKMDDDTTALLVLKKFLKCLIEFEGLEPKIITKYFLVSALNVITDIYLRLKEYEKSLCTSAFVVAISPDKCEEWAIRWIKIKSACRENSTFASDDIQQLTMNTALTKYQSEYREYCPEFKLDRTGQIKLLETELGHYKSKWKSKVPMMAVYRELCDLADPLQLGRIFTETWGEADLHVHDQLPKLLADTIARYKAQVDGCLANDAVKAHLLYLHHKYHVKDMILRTCDDMDKTMSVPKPSDGSQEMVPPDPDDDCDIFSSYNALKIKNYLKMMAPLNESFAILRSILCDISRKNLDLIDGHSMYGLLKKIAFEYRLHAHSVSCYQAWELALYIAELLSCDLYIVESCTFLLEVSDVRRKDIHEVLHKSQSAIDRINWTDHRSCLILYHLHKADAFLPYDFALAYKSFQSALELTNQINGDLDKVLAAKLSLIHHKFITLPCKFNVQGHQEHSLIKIHQACNEAIRFYNKAESNNSYSISVLFEIYKNIARMYHGLRMPREVRCYSKETIFLSQKLVLPFQTMSLLYYLAVSDINCCNMDDYRVKLRDFADILCLAKTTTAAAAAIVVEALQKPPLDNDKLDQVMEDLNSEFKELMLDLPAKSYRQQSAASPTFPVEKFKFPSQLSHESDCECFYCTSVEYQHFVLKKTYLEALFNIHDDNAGVAKEYFYGCLNIHRFLISRQKCYAKKVGRQLKLKLLPDLKDAFLEIYCNILWEYGNSLLRTDNVVEAQAINKKLLDSLTPMKIHHVHLYNEALSQKLNILATKLNRSVSQATLSPCTAASAEYTNNGSGDCMRTPETKTTKVNIVCEVSPKIPTAVGRKVVKRIKFDIYDAEEDKTNVQNKTKNLPLFLSDTGKTPGPSSSKIKVYTRTPRRKKPPVLGETDKSNSADSQESVVPMSPDAYTPKPTNRNQTRLRVENNDDALKSRTKLLTQKLKASINKATPALPSVVVNDENNSESGSTNSSQTVRPKRGCARKNPAAEDLKDADDSNKEQEGTIRRSRRAKK